MAQRIGLVVGVKPEKLAYYVELHAKPWPRILELLGEAHVRDYSIWHTELQSGEHLLFAQFEYTGDDIDGDMERLAEDAEMQRWWRETDPCQVSVGTGEAARIWNRMGEVFRFEG
jgi:L-rhamnose mutarotase